MNPELEDKNISEVATNQADHGAYFGVKISLRKVVFYMASIALFVIVYLKLGEVSELREIFLRSNISWLLVAIFLQALTYHCLALNYHYVFRIKGHTVSSWELYPMALITQFLNQAFPSAGLSGQIFLVDYLRSRGATVVEGVGRAILEISSMFCGFGILFVLASITFLSTNAFHMHPEFIYLIYIFWFFAAVFLTVFFTIQRPKNKGFIGKIISYFKIRSEFKQETDKNKKQSKLKNYWSVFTQELRENMNLKSLEENRNLFLMAMVWQLVIFILDVLTLYALALALGIKISLPLILVIFTFTQFISMISFVPGSLIVYEGGMSIMLIAFGVEKGSALTLALLFRALIFWLPMPIGWWLYRKHEKDYNKHRPLVHS